MNDEIKDKLIALENRITDLEYTLELRLDKVSVLEDQIQTLNERKELQVTDEELHTKILMVIKKYHGAPDIKVIQKNVIEASQQLHTYADMIKKIQGIFVDNDFVDES